MFCVRGMAGMMRGCHGVIRGLFDLQSDQQRGSSLALDQRIHISGVNLQ